MLARRTPARLAILALALLGGACSDPTVAPTTPSNALAETALTPRLPALGLVSGGVYRENLNFLSSPNGPFGPTNPWPAHTPAPWRPTDFDVAIHSRDQSTWYAPETFRANHGIGCQPFQTDEPTNVVKPGDDGTHEVHTYDDLNYRCRNHMMTALKSTGYGAIYLTPNAMVDFATGEASIKFALSTFRSSGRD